MERRGRQAQGAAEGAGAREAGLLALLVGPVEEAGDDLEDLELAGVGAVEGEELDEVVGDDLSVGWVSLGCLGLRRGGGYACLLFLRAWSFLCI